jgi:hypothetical protein
VVVVVVAATLLLAGAFLATLAGALADFLVAPANAVAPPTAAITSAVMTAATIAREFLPLRFICSPELDGLNCTAGQMLPGDVVNQTQSR